MLLTDILERYSSTDNRFGTDKITLHSYGDMYNSIFTPLRDTEGVSVLEIGIFSGAFLEAVTDYLLSSANICGIDTDLSNLVFARNKPNVRVFEMDGTSEDTAAHLNTLFDVIVEDGSHQPDHQIRTLDVFAPYLKKGGVYVIEDIHGAYADTIYPYLLAIAEKHGLVMEWHDLRSKKDRYDDIAAVFRRQ